MNALTTRLAATHSLAWGPTSDGRAVPSCTCEPGVRVDDFSAHMIDVTVAAFVDSLDTARDAVKVQGNWDRGVRYGLTVAEDVITGGAS